MLQPVAKFGFTSAPADSPTIYEASEPASSPADGSVWLTSSAQAQPVCRRLPYGDHGDVAVAPSEALEQAKLRIRYAWSDA